MNDGETENVGYYDALCDISIAIVSYRAKYSMSQEDLANKLGYTVRRIKNIESANFNITVEELSHIAHKLGIKLSISME